MQQITLTSKLENRGHYVPGMISGDKLYISGQLPVHHETGSPMADSIEQQTRDALHNVERVLLAAGCTKEDVVLCRVYIPLQIRIEVTDNCLPLHRTFFHAVKQSFHHCSKPNIYNAWESLFHNIVDNFSKFCHVEIFLFFGHITTADDCCDRRRIRTRTSDSLFFQCFYQRCLCIMCRRLCEMLFRL